MVMVSGVWLGPYTICSKRIYIQLTTYFSRFKMGSFKLLRLIKEIIKEIISFDSKKWAT